MENSLTVKLDVEGPDRFLDWRERFYHYLGSIIQQQCSDGDVIRAFSDCFKDDITELLLEEIGRSFSGDLDTTFRAPDEIHVTIDPVDMGFAFAFAAFRRGIDYGRLHISSDETSPFVASETAL